MAKCLIFTMAFIAIFSFPIAGFSQEQQEEDAEYGYGTVVEIRKDSNEIVINEYGWENDIESEVTYSIHADAKTENVDSWKNIRKGAYIDIEYVKGENNKRIANYISVYEPEITEEAEEEAE